MIFGVPLNTLIFFGQPWGHLQLLCVGLGFDSMSSLISISANLRKLRLTPL